MQNVLPDFMVLVVQQLALDTVRMTNLVITLMAHVTEAVKMVGQELLAQRVIFKSSLNSNLNSDALTTFFHELQFYFNGLGNLFTNRFSACQKGTFGPNCMSKCSDICPEDTRCLASNEGCNAKCEPGLTGDRCDTGTLKELPS